VLCVSSVVGMTLVTELALRHHLVAQLDGQLMSGTSYRSAIMYPTGLAGTSRATTRGSGPVRDFLDAFRATACRHRSRRWSTDGNDGRRRLPDQQWRPHRVVGDGAMKAAGLRSRAGRKPVI